MAIGQKEIAIQQENVHQTQPVHAHTVHLYSPTHMQVLYKAAYWPKAKVAKYEHT